MPLLVAPLLLASAAAVSVDWTPCAVDSTECTARGLWSPDVGPDEAPFAAFARTVGHISPVFAPQLLPRAKSARRQNNLSALCANVPLPLDPADSDPAEREVSVFVKHVFNPAIAAENRLGDVWLLQGGPGSSGVAMEALTGSLDNYNVYIPDHRGVGRSTRLGCSAQESDFSDGGFLVTPDEWDDCLAAIEADGTSFGLNELQYFTTTAAANDLALLVNEISAGQPTVVYGVSYGTYWLHRFLQLGTAAIDGAVFDGACPPGLCDLTSFDANHNEIGLALLDICKEDQVCNSHLSDPVATVESLFEKVARDNFCPALGIDAVSLRLTLAFLLRVVGLREYVPVLVYRMERCRAVDAEIVNDFFNNLNALLAGEDCDPTTRYSSDALQNNIVFSELWDDSAYSSVDEALAFQDTLYFSAEAGSTKLQSAYNDWPRYTNDDPLIGEYVDVLLPETMVLNGDLDAQTPMEWGVAFYDALPSTPRSQFVGVPNGGHAVAFHSQCARNAFLDFTEEVLTGATVTPQGDCTPLTVDFEGAESLNIALFGTGDIWAGAAAGAAPGLAVFAIVALALLVLA